MPPGEMGPWILTDNRLLASGTALSRRLLQELRGLDPDMGDYWDWDLWLRAYRKGAPFRYLKGRGLGIRVHGGNQSHGNRRTERQIFLERLRGKHGLPPLGLKDHLSFGPRGPGPSPVGDLRPDHPIPARTLPSKKSCM